MGDSRARQSSARPGRRLHPPRVAPYSAAPLSTSPDSGISCPCGPHNPGTGAALPVGNLRDSWSPRERAETAGRISTYLQHSARSAAETGDRTALAAAINQAISLGALTGQFSDWLPEASQRLLACGGWALLPDRLSESSGPLHALMLGLRGARERRSGRLDDSIALTDQALAMPGLPASLRQFLLLHRANALRVAGRYSAAAGDYRQLTQDENAFSDDARYWLADYSFLQGKFGEACPAPPSSLTSRRNSAARSCG
jgi:hypothetical protein